MHLKLHQMKLGLAVKVLITGVKKIELRLSGKKYRIN